MKAVAEADVLSPELLYHDLIEAVGKVRKVYGELEDKARELLSDLEIIAYLGGYMDDNIKIARMGDNTDPRIHVEIHGETIEYRYNGDYFTGNIGLLLKNGQFIKRLSRVYTRLKKEFEIINNLLIDIDLIETMYNDRETATKLYNQLQERLATPLPLES